ncbi:MAG: CDP-glucose 4,6-dehydratase [Phycisphaerae bacterium]|nr:CDP-glucose 4,6-dehydratase [Phycisphaerae bacterium]
MGNQNSFWQDRPVLVTGASGLLGSALVRYLCAARADVVALLRDWVPTSELVRSGLLERIKVVRGDVTDLSCIERVLGEYEIDTVFHLGAQTIVGVANRQPLSTFRSNIEGTWNLLEACRLSPRVRQIIVASSDKAYGQQSVLPYDERMPLQGVHPYDCSKSCADLICRCYAVTFASPVCVTRCGNLYGPGDLNWNRIVPGTVRSVLRNQSPIIRSNGQFVRDYLYVDDGALAYMRVAEALAQQRELAGEAFNFSNEQPQTVVELVQRILHLMNRTDLPLTILNQAGHEIPEQFLSSRKARERLQWQPKYDLELGLRESIRWYTNLLSNDEHDTPSH